MSLDARKKEILKAIVDDYVTTCEPVGSKALIERHNFTLSSATLRNEMAELEKLGYLEKPHTSAGRIPSDKGYRFYVDELLKDDNISLEEVIYIQSKLGKCSMLNIFKAITANIYIITADIIAIIVALFPGIIPSTNIYIKYEHTHIAAVATIGFTINFEKFKLSLIVLLVDIMELNQLLVI